MPKESWAMISRRYQYEALEGKPFYVPHEWDRWFVDKVRTYWSRESLDPIAVQNVLGEAATVYPRKDSSYSWDSRYLKSDCATCPFYVPATGGNKEQLELLVKLLKHRARANMAIPEKYRGLCLFSQTSREEVIPKFLVDNHHHPSLRGCNIGVTARSQRAEQRKLG